MWEKEDSPVIMAGMQIETKNENRVNHQIARGAVTVMAAFVISNLIGLAAKILTARYFGTGIESNAFFAANRFSEILFNLVAGGALGSAFIPVFTGMLAEGETKKAWRLASSIVNIVLVILVVASFLTIIFSRQVVQNILAPGFGTEAEVLTARLLRVQVLSTVIFGMSGLVMGILNAHQHFFLPAIAPAMYQVGWIIGIGVFRQRLGIFGLAWGVVLGAVLHLCVQIPKLAKLPFSKYTASIHFKMPEVKEVALLMGPRLLGVAVVQINFLLNTFLASYQTGGSITALSLAFPLMIMPEAAIAQSIAIASLPTFSAQVAMKKFEEMRHSLSSTLRAVILLSVPASIGLILLRFPIVTFLYKGNAFTNDSVALVAWALLWYALGLVGHSLVEISSRAFYALHDTKTPVLVGIGAMTGNLLLSFLFTSLFSGLGWMPHGGLALANTSATMVESVILLILLRKKINGFDQQSITGALVQSLVAGAVMAAAIWIINRSGASWQPILSIFVSVLTGAVIYLVALRLQNTAEIQVIEEHIKKRLKRS